MKRSLKWKLIAGLMTIAGAFLLGGCSGCKFHYSVENKREELGLAASVTYHANGADAKFGAEDTELILYFAEDAVALNIGTDRLTNGANSIPALTYTNHTFIAWYEGEADGQGNVTLASQPFDFSTRLDAGNLDLYAKWQKNEMVNVQLVCDEISQDVPFTVNGEVKVNGAEIAEFAYAPDGKLNKLAATAPVVSGYTFYEYYKDEACTQLMDVVAGDWPIIQDEKHECTIYAKYIVGEWRIIRTANQLKNFLFSSNGTYNYYLANDIDCEENFSVSAMQNLSGTIEGNGHTIRGLTVSGGTFRQDNSSTAMFGTLRSSAKVQNVTFENLTYKCTLSGAINAKVFFFCSAIEEGASVENLTFTGDLTMQVSGDSNATVLNMTRGEELHTDNLFFGKNGALNDTDVFTAEDNVTVVGNVITDIL